MGQSPVSTKVVAPQTDVKSIDVCENDSVTCTSVDVINDSISCDISQADVPEHVVGVCREPIEDLTLDQKCEQTSNVIHHADVLSGHDIPVCSVDVVECFSDRDNSELIRKPPCRLNPEGVEILEKNSETQHGELQDDLEVSKTYCPRRPVKPPDRFGEWYF